MNSTKLLKTLLARLEERRRVVEARMHQTNWLEAEVRHGILLDMKIILRDTLSDLEGV